MLTTTNVSGGSNGSDATEIEEREMEREGRGRERKGEQQSEAKEKKNLIINVEAVQKIKLIN